MVFPYGKDNQFSKQMQINCHLSLQSKRSFRLSKAMKTAFETP
ncbi:hypothetical protein HMPREF0971_03105 [Segatella oris F0302]|uniref:Uncharacterized protein n=1 Tax=Segatella oris F0302 TaxID=649760 RepID=D1QVR5_9BACT|nr:hypothetical protein HMPREF0971_03105 [Segatella oris F0302]